MNERLAKMMQNRMFGALGTGAPETTHGESTGPSIPPFVASMLKALGVSPEVITGLVVTLQQTAQALQQTASLINDRLTRIEAEQISTNEKLAQLEHLFCSPSDADERLQISVVELVPPMMEIDPKKAN